MKKTYEPETKSAIEQVIDVFNDYIRTSTHFELLWSDKVGYGGSILIWSSCPLIKIDYSAFLQGRKTD